MNLLSIVVPVTFVIGLALGLVVVLKGSRRRAWLDDLESGRTRPDR